MKLYPQKDRSTCAFCIPRKMELDYGVPINRLYRYVFWILIVQKQVL